MYTILIYNLIKLHIINRCRNRNIINNKIKWMHKLKIQINNKILLLLHHNQLKIAIKTKLANINRLHNKIYNLNKIQIKIIKILFKVLKMLKI